MFKDDDFFTKIKFGVLVLMLMCFLFLCFLIDRD